MTFVMSVSCSEGGHTDKSDLQELYASLDEEIARSTDYEEAKDIRISRLRNDYNLTRNEAQRTGIINGLIAEFDAYNADSALYYVGVNLGRRAVLSEPGEYTRLLIKRADVFAHAGLFTDAMAIMQAIPGDSLVASLLESYYATWCAIYQYLSEYSAEHETILEYEARRSLYIDSLNRVVDPGSFDHMVYVMSELARNGESDSAISVLSDRLGEYSSGTREYSILASTMAFMYKTAGRHDEHKRYLALSAISDIKGAVKENMSFRELATVMFEDGDIERANRYLKKSIADANFYSALMRNIQSSNMLPVIDDAYSAKQAQLNSRLRMLVWTGCVLSFLLILALLFIARQYKSLRHANAMVNSSNKELEAINGELRELNMIKEQYAGLFMAYCSSAISTLQRYQQQLRVVTAQGGTRTAMINKLDVTKTVDSLLKDFYVKFDEAILSIYPSFVEKFNALLTPDGQVTLKSGELLNTELRLYALIRIGIDDSTKIAEFLRCSLSTIYTYRSKMRRRAINPDRFEDDVRDIV